MSNSNDQTSSFDKHLRVFTRSIEQGKAAARACAIIALEHFRDHGNLVLCQRLLDVMSDKGKNYVRRTAYLKWLVAFAPVMMEGGRLLKDTRATANKLNVEGAAKVDFWDFAPEAIVMNMSNEEVFKALRAKLGAFLKDKVKVTPEIKASITNLLRSVDEEERRVAAIQPATTAAAA